ncbi:MAG: hypothetical protein M3161_05895, partial [Actinomycetota bacterium]|nr:hypothetical protein [Actinomycetota bacterium]
MRSRTIAAVAVIACLVLAVVAAPAGSTPAASQSSDYDRDHILVGWERGLPDQARADVHAQEGGEVANRLGWIDVDVVEVPENQDPADWVARYQRHPQVAFAELNYEVEQTSVPSDTLFRDQWG